MAIRVMDGKLKNNLILINKYAIALYICAKISHKDAKMKITTAELTNHQLGCILL